jgi:hypothetical protein
MFRHMHYVTLRAIGAINKSCEPAPAASHCSKFEIAAALQGFAEALLGSKQDSKIALLD